MTTENILCLLCGSLAVTILHATLWMRWKRDDQRVRRRIRRNAYLRGWQDAKDASYRAEI